MNFSQIINMLDRLKNGEIPTKKDIDAAIERIRKVQIYFSIDWYADDKKGCL